MTGNDHLPVSILTSGYSSQFGISRLDLLKKNLDTATQVETDDNLTFGVYDAQSATAFFIHEVDNHSQFPKSGALSSWKVEHPTTGPAVRLTQKQVVSSLGSEPAHLALHPQTGQLWVSNYGGGSLAVYASRNGSIGDLIWSHTFTQGSGRARAYLINELADTLDVLKIDAQSGILSHLATIPYKIPEPSANTRQYGAGIEIHPEGDFLYVSNRGDGAILVYAILDGDQSSYLHLEQVFKTHKTWPRSFSLSPDGTCLIVPDQLAHCLDLLAIEPDTGRLRLVQTVDTIQAPAICLPLLSA
eukprot:maker-scaffold1646_size32207-snap-gene-0.8 protein:Tk02697 transcript:maker-scaffold1646_size32207-snap-gene-0.8-mRNA-1 annotation:"PREDICTED: 6-phosphogluconolactonase-like"